MVTASAGPRPRTARLRPVRISGLSTYVPPRTLTNADLEKMVDTSDEWILQRTGIRERHIVDPGTATSDLAKEAARGRHPQAGLTPDDIGFIVVGTTTPDTIFPSTACLLQHKIGAHHAWGFDLGAACSGFLYALTTGMHMVASGAHEHALVVGADVMSSIIDYKDRTDLRAVRRRRRGGGAVGGGRRGAVASSATSTRSTAPADRRCACRRAAAACRRRTRPSTSGCTTSSRMARRCSSSRSGRAARSAAACSTGTASTRRELDLFVSHQANRRIIQAAAERLGLPLDKVVINLEHYGNTTAATIPLALADAVREGRLKKGDLVLLASVGAGFTAGAMLLRWSL